MIHYLKLLYIAVIGTYTLFGHWNVVLPVRAALVMFLLLMLFVCVHNAFIEFVVKRAGLILVIISISAIGIFVTSLNGKGFDILLEYTLRNGVQPLAILMSSYLMAQFAGPMFVVRTFLFFAGLTGVFAIFQAVGFDFAWQAREWLASFQDHEPALRSYIAARVRPFGLSLTPIVFSYHIAAAYVVVQMIYERGLIGSRVYFALTLGNLAIAAANGTRSLLLGILIAAVLREVVKMRVKSLLTLAVVGLICGAGLVILQNYDSRVVSFDDESALGRFTLYQFGLRLAADFPFGLGWSADVGEYASFYWEYVATGVNAEAIFRLDVHNAYLNFFLTYGLLGTIVIVACFLIDPPRFMHIIWIFFAYFIHGFFHNNGVFLGDYFVWVAFGLYLWLYQPAEAGAPARSRVPAVSPSR
ncbi:O-antigen ligase family protein [Afifella pfennigii]|uniref:O-antigen ligase family protein n=1 Tax=Afifella pfennigii TaxID=209897 RepID=UPI0012EC281C|nr:O-antigen ligase family protein [Afifella pfennigii]